MSKQVLLNTYIDNLTFQEVLDRIDQMIPERKSRIVVELNVDVIMIIENDPLLKKISDEADLTLVDGKPLLWISKFQHRPIKEKVSGSDLMFRTCEMAAEKGYSVFILGGKDKVPEQAAENLKREYAGLQICGTYSPPFGFEEDEAELEHINEMLNEADPDILFACLGCPKQEKWLYANREKFRSGVCLCAGASVDFAAGKVKRAPKWMSSCGLEWFYRFLKEPKRLFRRYFINDTKIICLMFKYRNEQR